MSHGQYDPKDHFTLRYHPRNQGVMRVAERHAMKKGDMHIVSDLMDDLPQGDICAGMCCFCCDWERTFPFRNERLRKTFGAEQSELSTSTFKEE